MDNERLEGEERDHYLDHNGCACGVCGFTEDALIVIRAKDGQTSVRCVECLDQTEHPESEDLALVYLPEMPISAFSHYVRMLAFVTFAAKVDGLDRHDFSDGTLPPRFRTSEGWGLPIRFRTLKEGIDASNAAPPTIRDLEFARRSFEFLKSRIEYAKAVHGALPLSMMLKNDSKGPASSYRAVAPGIAIPRIRSWGNPGSSFRMIGKTKQ